MRRYTPLFALMLGISTLLFSFTIVQAAPDLTTTLSSLTPTLMVEAPADVTSPTPVTQRSWGSLKAIYRGDREDAATQTSTTAKIQKPGVGLTRLSGDPRTALVLEGYFSILQSYNGSYAQTYNGYPTSNWSYMLSDPNAYRNIKTWYGSYASIWTGWPSYFNNMDVYSRSNLNRFGVKQGFDLSHGGQCRGFVNLLTYRSATFQQKFPVYGGCPWGYRSYSQIQPGDVIETTWANGHTALVVTVTGGVAGSSVTAVKVVDSNWIGDEVIGMHTISVTYGGGVGDLRSYRALNLPLQ